MPRTFGFDRLEGKENRCVWTRREKSPIAGSLSVIECQTNSIFPPFGVVDLCS
jgi:hypothetical protein